MKQYCRVLGGENWETDHFLGIAYRSVVTHAFSLVIFTQGPNLYPDTPSQWISHKTLLERTRWKQFKKTHTIISSSWLLRIQVKDLKKKSGCKNEKEKPKQKLHSTSTANKVLF